MTLAPVPVPMPPGPPGALTLVLPHPMAASLLGDVWLIGLDWQDAPQTAFRIEAPPPGPSGPAPCPLACALYLHGPTLRTRVQPLQQPAGKFGEVIAADAAAGGALGPRPGQVFMAQMLKVAFGPGDYDAWALHDLAALVDAAGRVAQSLSVGPREARAMPHGFGVNADCLARPIRRWSEAGPCKRVRRVAERDRLWWVFYDLAEQVSLSTGDLVTVCG
jgi:hypothetical protein